MKVLLLCVVLGLAVGCASFRPTDATPSIRTITTPDGGTCTAFAIGPRKWLTAAHCTTDGVLSFADGTVATVLAVHVASDVALVVGPPARAFRLAASAPRMGDPLHIFGYGLGRGVLILLPGVYIEDQSHFFDGTEAMLIGMANGMPGMSGGPIFAGRRVVSVITGGGQPYSTSQLLGMGVSFEALRAFVVATGADKY